MTLPFTEDNPEPQDTPYFPQNRRVEIQETALRIICTGQTPVTILAGLRLHASVTLRNIEDALYDHTLGLETLIDSILS